MFSQYLNYILHSFYYVDVLSDQASASNHFNNKLFHYNTMKPSQTKILFRNLCRITLMTNQIEEISRNIIKIVQYHQLART